MAGYSDIRVERRETTAIVTLNRPHKLNAITQDTVAELVAALDEVDADDDVRALIVTGEGRAFCAGADISGGFEVPKTGDPATGEGIQPDPGGRVTLRLFRMQKPVIAAINGPAIGFGSSVLLPMDFRVASTAARFAFPFTKRAIVPESCSSWFLPRVVGIATALDWMMSGRTFPVDEAKKAGLVQEVVAPETLMTRAMEIATRFTEGTSPASVGLVRRLLWAMLGEAHPMTAHSLESRGLVAAYRAADYDEGFRSFLEKRAPRFVSRPHQDLAYAEQWLPEPPFGAGQRTQNQVDRVEFD